MDSHVKVRKERTAVVSQGRQQQGTHLSRQRQQQQQQWHAITHEICSKQTYVWMATSFVLQQFHQLGQNLNKSKCKYKYSSISVALEYSVESTQALE
jgi:hypothetical protein